MVALVELTPAPDCLPPFAPVDPRLLDRAQRPGRIRGAALEALAAARDRPAAAAPVLRAWFRRATWLHSGERRFASDLVYDVLRWERLLDDLVDDAPGDEARLRRLLVGFGASAGSSDRDRAPAIADPVDAWARYASLPPRFVASLARSLGPATAAVLSAMQRRAPLGLRVDLRKATRADVVAALAAEGVVARTGQHSATAVVVEGRIDVERSEPWRRGWVDVQDEASQCVVDAVPPGDVLDLCAGAGGKALAMAERGRRVVATDLRRSALEELGRRASRSGVALQIVAPDDLPRRIDVVLIDAPCSGLGTLRRHPELRLGWGRKGALAGFDTQRELLGGIGRHVRSGAVVWATCSLLAEENEQVADDVGRSAKWTRWEPATHGTDGMTVGRISPDGRAAVP